ncbi:energy-coupling factor transporter transmembrane component T family protein [Alkalicoccus halolimnae]|uniref:Energy-coupling factor transporter transmembrane protein EcfT n=1 Tax=Alkalicoccus halolimnae TaxID=1667239 RepID=A0A5C7F559_9BACI|nr:energy-coupling factor transporter transmembrane protein EcfT [Alkalicoccus halolimnae]TXF83618.1 energy-coupling factor transporter transmembrane protein EcfT [Alkalicoccus halolimnae]
MFDNVIIGQYMPGRSLIHSLDPRSKLTAVVLFMVFIFISRDPFVLGMAVLMTVTAFLLAKIPFKFFWKGIRVILLIVVLTFTLHIFMTREGEVWLDFGWMTVYSGGVIEGGLIALRLLLLIVLATMLTLTTTPVDLTDGMERLMKPLQRIRVPTHELALMMSIALRFIPTLLEETQKIVKAQTARGASFSQGSMWKRLNALIPVLIPLFVQSFKRAEDLAIAMEARGYAGGEGRTKFRQLSWQKRDTFLIALFLAFGAFSITTRIL